MFGFEHPGFLFLILLLPCWYVARQLGLLPRTELPMTIGDWTGVPFRWQSRGQSLAIVTVHCCAISGLVMLIAALAGPVLYRQEVVYTGSGTEIFFVVDISPSMAALDMSRSDTERTRLDTARYYIRTFIKARPGDSFALVAVGNSAALLVPPTADQQLFLDRLSDLAVGELGDDTALGMGLAVAAAHLSNRRVSRSHIILLTDGESNAGEIGPETAAGVLRKYSDGFTVIGIGTQGEVPLEYADPVTGRRYTGYLDSRFSEPVMRSLAVSGGGRYFSAANPASLESVFEELGRSIPVNRSALPRVYGERLERRFALVAAFALSLAWFFRRVVLGDLL